MGQRDEQYYELQPHKGPSETRAGGRNSGWSGPLQPHKGPSETKRVGSGRVGGDSLQPHKGPSETGGVRVGLGLDREASTPQGSV